MRRTITATAALALAASTGVASAPGAAAEPAPPAEGPAGVQGSSPATPRAEVRGATVVRMPVVGERLRGTVLQWLVQPGDHVEVGDPIVEIETDKAIFELTAPAGGVVLAVAAREGTSVRAGAVLATIGPRKARKAAAPAPR